MPSNNTKASRLNHLKKCGFGNYLLPQFVVRKATISSDLELLKNQYRTKNTIFAVRSSSSDEDQELSNAGKFLSILNVELENISQAVEAVLQTYSPDEKYGEVLIQPMLTETIASGVLFTADPSTGSPYRVVNLNFSGSTDSITSGSENGRLLVSTERALVSSRNSPGKQEHYISQLIKVAELISGEYGNKPIDVEFAFTKEWQLIILQVRPLQVKEKFLPDIDFKNQLEVCHKMFLKVSTEHPTLFGEETLLSVMSDWNPAELIGVRPTQLAISLFKELISDNIWAYERSNFGYRNIRSFPLMIELAGQPYIDLRVSFNSLMPAGIADTTAKELSRHYLDEFKSNPKKHDKVEFDLYFSSYTTNTKSRLGDSGISKSSQEDLLYELKSLTKGIIRSSPYGLQQSLNKSEPLDRKFHAIMKSELMPESKVYWLVEDCKRYGTLPFSGIARCAFIATEILKSFLADQTISQSELDLFLQNIDSIPSQMGRDLKSMQIDSFIEKYGHLRPGTFDIRNLTYRENFNGYFKLQDINPSSVPRRPYNPDPIIEKVSRAHSVYLEEIGVSAEELLEFCRLSISERENVKFKFSRHVSAILDTIVELGEQLSISREELAHLDVRQILKQHSESIDRNLVVRDSITLGQKNFVLTQGVWLPPVIINADDVYEFEVPQSIPNYVTQMSVMGQMVTVDKDTDELAQRILLIESADPGFDWIFSHDIAGLITCYGGANSHMAVRAYELSIPAAIGVGEQLFSALKHAKSVFLDCPNKRIEVLE